MKEWLGSFLTGSLLIFAFAVTVTARPNSESYLATYDTPETKIRAGFVPYKVQVVLGEPLQATFTVQNFGPTNFEFWFGGDYRGTGRHDRFKIAVTNAAGEVLPDPIANATDFGGFVQEVNLKPGQVFANLVNLADFRVMANPGIYTISCSFAFDDHMVKEGPSNPIVRSTFKLTILERTPERVAEVLDELADKVKTAHGQDLGNTLALIANFGKDEAIPRLAKLAENGPVEQRCAALSALSLVPTDDSLDIILSDFKDSSPAIQAAAASSLGEMKQPRAVEALLDAFPNEKSPVAEAVLLALGMSKSDRAFPVITNALESGGIEMQRAAIDGLVNFGGSNTVAVLQQHINTNFLSVRYEIVLALAEQLHQPMQPEWLLPVLVGREQNHEWLDSLRLLRMYGGEKAIPTMLSCLDFDVAWSGRNWWILETGLKPCSNAPPCDYEYDPNSEGTSEQKEKNLRTLQALKPLAAPLPKFSVRPVILPPTYLKTDPPIDFAPIFREEANGTLEVKSGFLTLNAWRLRDNASFNTTFGVSDSYRSLYQSARCLRSLPNDAKRREELNITPEQLKQLDGLLHHFALKLCNSRVINNKPGNFYQELISVKNYNVPFDDDWFFLESNYFESPPGPIHDQAKADLMNSVQALSQNYHTGTVEFVEAVRKVLTTTQLEQLLRYNETNELSGG